jgi:hypothetical protein
VGQGGHGKGFLETLHHHVIVLGSACLKLCSRRLAELVAMGLKRGLIYLPVILDDVNGDTLLVWKLGDSHSPWFHPMMLQWFLKVLTNAVVVEGII